MKARAAVERSTSLGTFCWTRNSSNIIADYARDALFSVRSMGGQYYQIARALESLAISEHGNTHEQTE